MQSNELIWSNSIKWIRIKEKIDGREFKINSKNQNKQKKSRKSRMVCEWRFKDTPFDIYYVNTRHTSAALMVSHFVAFYVV